MTYQIGQTIALVPHRGIIGADPIAPRWHALRVAPRKERSTREILKAKGVRAFYPEEERTRHVAGRKIVTSFPTVSQIVYARFTTQPQWDVLRDRKIITGVFCYGSTPICLDRDVIRSLQGLPTRAEEIAQAKEAMRRQMFEVSAGDRAEMLEGPLAGLVVDVTRSHGGRVWWQAIGGGIKGDCAFGSIKRQDVA